MLAEGGQAVNYALTRLPNNMQTVQQVINAPRGKGCPAQNKQTMAAVMAARFATVTECAPEVHTRQTDSVWRRRNLPKGRNVENRRVRLIRFYEILRHFRN